MDIRAGEPLLRAMKFLAYIVVLLMAVLAFAVHHVAQQTIMIDHLQQSVQRLEKRETCLLRLSGAFLASQKPGELKTWIKTNLADLNMREELTRVRINEVIIDLVDPAMIE